MDQDKGFLGGLFDFSFRRFVTPKLLKVLYALGLLIALFAAIRFIGAGFDRGFLAGLVSLIISPALFVLYAVLARVVVELVMVLFRIAEGVGGLSLDEEPAPEAVDPDEVVEASYDEEAPASD